MLFLHDTDLPIHSIYYESILWITQRHKVSRSL